MKKKLSQLYILKSEKVETPQDLQQYLNGDLELGAN